MGEKADRWSQMGRWDALGGQTQREALWEADVEDVYAQEWAGAYPGPWGSERLRVSKTGVEVHRFESGRVEQHGPERQSVI